MTHSRKQDPALQGLQVYIVGGAVRDALLDLPAGDRDWVVVGATPESMVERGFIPVGGDFPVFLHPRTKEEYALARTERKSGRGYKGFTFYTGADVTLEDDLTRRDLTINAIAQDPEGRLIDPLDGQQDIQQRVLRHVGHAFVEDPVRLLRLARFAARFGDFTIAPETLDLARRLVHEGEVDHLVPERIWLELTKGLMAQRPPRMFEVLAETGALERVIPDLVFNDTIARELDCAVYHQLGLSSRFALLCRLSPHPVQIGKSIRAPSDCQDYARLLPLMVEKVDAPEVESWLDLIEHCDGLRKPARFLDLIRAVQCVRQVDATAWKSRLDTVREVDAGAVASAHRGKPERIKAAVRDARLAALREAARICPGVSPQS